jgi:hypothetical protein
VKRRPHLAALGVALVLLLSLVAAGSAAGWGESAVPYGEGKIAYDCAGGASLAPGSKTTVDWVIWCGPVSGRMRIEVEAPKAGGRVRWSGPAKVAGPAGRPSCKVGRAKMNCELRKSGPITVRGSFTVSAGACVGKTVVSIPTGDFRDGEGFYKEPWGCPGSRPPAPPKLSSILKFRATEVLDPGLAGDRGAEVAKARRLRQAWIDEEPVERWSQVAWESPLDASDAKLMALRRHATEQAGRLIEGWVGKHQMLGTYAGWYWGPDGSIFIGFTQEPDATVARMKSELSFIEPAWVKPFETPPVYTKGELEALTGQIVTLLEERGGFGSIVGIGTDVLANKVRVSATDPSKARRLLTAKFGTDAPIEVVKGYPLQLL